MPESKYLLEIPSQEFEFETKEEMDKFLKEPVNNAPSLNYQQFENTQWGYKKSWD